MIALMIVFFFKRFFLASLLLPAPAVTMAQPLEKVEMLLDWKALPTFAGYCIAREQGAFERRGLDVTFKEVQGATVATEQIGSSSSMVSVQLQFGQPPIGGQTREGWEDTIKLLFSLNLLARPVAVDEVAILK